MGKRLGFMLVLPLLLSACAQSQGEKVREARLGQLDAKEATELAAADQRARTSGAAVEREHAALGQAIDKANEPGELHSTTLVEVSRERATYQAMAKARMERLSIRLESIKRKIDVLGPHAPTSMHTLFDTAKTEHDDLKQDVDNLGSVTPDGWPAMKRSIDKRSESLNERLEELNEAIHDL